MDTKLLQYILVKKGITQENLAHKLGVSRQALSRRMNGKTKFQIDDIKTIQSYLKIGDDDIKQIFFSGNVK